MPLIITKKPITTLPVQGFFCMWNQQQTDASMLSIMEKWSVKRAVKKLENGRDFAKTGAYHFSAKYIVHIKEPKNTGSGDRKQPVTALFSQCLKYAHDQLMDSIALPLWSSAFADLSAIEVEAMLSKSSFAALRYFEISLGIVCLSQVQSTSHQR